MGRNQIESTIDAEACRATLDYARRCEGPPTAFTLTPESGNSSLGVLLAGVRVLRHFGAAPRYPESIRSFVQGCQTSLGGFGRTPGAIAGLAETRDALQVRDHLPAAGGGPQP
jgi:hypothetical protein